MYCHERYNKKRNRFYTDYVWSTVNKEESLKIEQLICMIQVMMHRYNEQLEMEDCDEKRMIINLPTLMLHKKHIEFLRFWFGYDTDLYHDCTFTMC